MAGCFYRPKRAFLSVDYDNGGCVECMYSVRIRSGSTELVLTSKTLLLQPQLKPYVL